MVIIGISGKKQSGKDESWKFIHSKYPSSIRLGFADALKHEISKGCGITVEYLDKNKEHFRLIMQGWGTDFRRKLCSDDYWIEQWLKKVLTLDCDVLVAPDVRFVNEAEAIRKIGGYVIRIERPSSMILPNDPHQSETELDNYEHFHHIIQNDSTIHSLYCSVDSVLSTLHI